MLKEKLIGDELEQVRSTLEDIPFNCILVDREGVIRYVNQAASGMFKRLEKHFDGKMDDLEEASLFSLHKNFEEWKKNLNEVMFEKKKIVVDAESESLHFSVRRADFCKNIDCFLVVVESFEKGPVQGGTHGFSARELIECMEMLQRISFRMEGVNGQIEGAKSVSEKTDAGCKSVHSNVRKMVEEIGDVERMVGELLPVSEQVDTLSEQLGGALSRSGKSFLSTASIVSIISSVAQQSSLLALNATIEAARAGEAGRGFSAVAGEIKGLSKQLGQVAQDIERTMESVDKNGRDAADLLGKIASAGKKINGQIEEQKNAVKKVSRTVEDCVGEMNRMDENITEGIRHVNGTGEEIAAVKTTLGELKDWADRLLKHFR